MEQATLQRILDTTNPRTHPLPAGSDFDITILGGIRLEGLDRMRTTLKVQVEHHWKELTPQP